MIQVMFIVAWLAASFSVATPNHHIPLVAAHSLEASHSLEAAHSLKAAHSSVVAHTHQDNLPELNSKQVYSGMMQMESKESMVQEKAIRRPLNIAHRGFSGRYPAHSMQGYIQGARAGADYIECDIQFTRDKVPVCLHNYWLSGVTDVAENPDLAAHKRPLLNMSGEGIHEDWAIWDLTLAEAKTLRLRQEYEGRSKEFDGMFTIPTFDEFVQAAREYGIGIYPELKHPSLYNKAWKIYNSTKDSIFIYRN
ncbi:glycerophosphodiester phosphodiesterase GDPD5 [Eurytemora carolleeae]|uniref:glycerophosphodiester phosphodiesterase GDPD5 n=1 Tax=Eurytemora carolleeae TaxID=1294199 RepID=UPI000C778A00|nr:glycerophosphodiester phosphodiesterase GDPD5 [Eurytemora carolleeae]|eukprot:XP_023323291.1 glycerophosphodiester phosphodiesterase GDPD5-like [Eurytemora affinis]